MDRLVLLKWQNVNNPTILHGDGTLGCPVLGAITHAETVASAGSVANTYEYKIAPFKRGSIYTVLTPGGTTVQPATYTPKVFDIAIEELSTYATGGTPVPVNDVGGIDEVGVPVADPTFDLSDDPTFLFQQFARPWYVARDPNGNVTEQAGSHLPFPGIPNTLEIRGLTPTLYVERIGGSFLDYKASFRGRSANCQGLCTVPVPGDRTPTIWQSSGCVVNPTRKPTTAQSAIRASRASRRRTTRPSTRRRRRSRTMATIASAGPTSGLRRGSRLSKRPSGPPFRTSLGRTPIPAWAISSTSSRWAGSSPRTSRTRTFPSRTSTCRETPTRP